MDEQIVRPQLFKARVAEHVLLAGKYQYIYFELVEPHRIQFQAGQYLLMTVPGGEEKKSYSISSSPEKDHGVEVLVDVSPQGDGSMYLQSLAPGDEVEFLAPSGQFVMSENVNEKELVFVATGSGISTLRSMILDLLEAKRDRRKITLHWGLRYVHDLFWEDDFEELRESFSQFHYDIVLSRPPESWPLCRGRVTDCLRTHETNYLESGFYLCGNQQMISEVTTFLTSKGVSKERVHFEKFY